MTTACCIRNPNRSQPNFLRSLAAFCLTGVAVWSRDKECPPRESWDPATTLWAVRGMRGGHWTSHDTGYNTVDNAVS